MQRHMMRPTGKPLGNRVAKRLVGAYAILVGLLIGVLAINERAPGQERVTSLSQLSPPELSQIKNLESRLVRNGVSLTLLTSTDGVIHDGVGKSIWTISGDARGQHAYIQYDRVQNDLARFSQSDPLEWSSDREQWTVNDARAAIATGQRYLQSLNWEGDSSHWALQGKPDLVDSVWRLAYSQGSHQLSLRLHRWNGVLVYLSRD